MYQICICDDEALFLDRIQKETRDYFSDRDDIEIITYDSSKLFREDKPEAQLYLLDVMMPGMTGLQLAGELRNSGSKAAIVFISSMSDPVFDSFQYQPLRYVRKEYLHQELHKALQAFMDLQTDAGHSFPLMINGSDILIPVSAFLYAESNGHYITFHCKEREYEVRGRLSDYSDSFGKLHVVQPCKSFLVNMRYISLFTNGEILLENGLSIPVSRAYKDAFKSAFMKYQRNYHYDSTI